MKNLIEIAHYHKLRPHSLTKTHTVVVKKRVGRADYYLEYVRLDRNSVSLLVLQGRGRLLKNLKLANSEYWQGQIVNITVEKAE